MTRTYTHANARICAHMYKLPLHETHVIQQVSRGKVRGGGGWGRLGMGDGGWGLGVGGAGGRGAVWRPAAPSLERREVAENEDDRTRQKRGRAGGRAGVGRGGKNGGGGRKIDLSGGRG